MPVQQLALFSDLNKAVKSTSTVRAMAHALQFEYIPGWPDLFGQSLRRWAIDNNLQTIRTLSLFSGGGGLDIGFHDAGFSIQTMVEFEPKFIETLNANCGPDQYFADSEALCQDIRHYHPPDNIEIDFIIGGPPCQTFSAAGRRAAGTQGTDDDRGMLFTEYVRLLEQLSPRGFLFENVYGITGSQNGEAWLAIQQAFAAAGYKIFFRILDTADFGVPQHRERLFIVGVKEGEYLFPRPTHGPDSPDKFPFYSAAKAISNLSAKSQYENQSIGGRFGHLLEDIPPGLNYSFYTEKMGHPQPVFAWRSKFSDFLYKADPTRPVRTIKAQGGQYTGPFHWDSRPFTIAELKRLQTIPDTYQILGGKQASIHQIGNSVPPQIARILAVSILQQLFGVDLPFDLPLLQPYEELGFRKRKRQLTQSYKAKAKKAISQLQVVDQKTAVSRTYTAQLSTKFKWTETNGQNTNGNLLTVQFVPDSQQWLFNIIHNKPAPSPEMRITVKPTPGTTWQLDANKVILQGPASLTNFTSLWKAFEYELNELKIKADLVQLCGYYQYDPRFTSHLELSTDNQTLEWQVIKKVVAGIGVGQIIAAEQLAELWHIELGNVLPMAKMLKKTGYEVRNATTNPQIPADHFLVPYAFPTLTPVSVQLHKSLSA